MPYVSQDVRAALDTRPPVDAGELNYVITMFCDDFLRRTGRKYANVNTVIGVLECAKQEFYRRIAAPYEDSKMQENGDVYSQVNLP